MSTEYRDAQDQMTALQVANWTNLALVFFKQGENIKCIEMCDQALQEDHKNVKALFWKGRANAEEAEYIDAIRDF